MNLGSEQVDEDLEIRVLSFLFEDPTDTGDANRDQDEFVDNIDADYTPVLDVLNIDAGIKRKSRLFSEDELLHEDVMSPKQRRKTVETDFLPNLVEQQEILPHFDVPNIPKITASSNRVKQQRRRCKLKSSPTKDSRKQATKDLRKQALTKSFESLDEKTVKERTEVRTIVARKADEIVTKKKRRKHTRSSYVCRLCGLPKKNHKCKFAPKVKTKKIIRVKKYVSIGIQCEMDMDMTVAAMKREADASSFSIRKPVRLVRYEDEKNGCMSPASSSLVHAMKEASLNVFDDDSITMAV